MRADEGPASLALNFAALNEQLTVDGSSGLALQRLVDLAVTSIPGCEYAAVTRWGASGGPHTPASSHAHARTVDKVQYELGEGPCLQAAADSRAVHIADLAVDREWPRFSRAVTQRTPVREVLALNLSPDRYALNLYSGTPGAIDADAQATAALFAAHARVLLSHAGALNEAATLTEALSTSRQIGTAIGIIMQTHKVSADMAFDILVSNSNSNRLNLKLREVADEITRTGDTTGTPSPSAPRSS